MSSSSVVGRDAKEDLRCVAVIGCCRSRRYKRIYGVSSSSVVGRDAKEDLWCRRRLL